MARTSKKQQADSSTATGEQLDLMEVGPENSQEIIRCARWYKAAQTKRIAALEEEIEAKGKLLALVKEAKLQRMEDGKIRFHCDGFTITVTPRDELIKVKADEEDDDGGGEG